MVTILQACGTLPRLDAVPPALTERAEIPGIPDARFWLDGDLAPFVQSVIHDTERERAALAASGKPLQFPPIDALAISGGGDAGAFAAGILTGWTARGDRPQFKVVTGISAGGLIAPFAFLGPRYDDVIRNIATSLGPGDVFRTRSTLTGLVSDGMADSEPLSHLVAKYVTPEVLEAVATEFMKGRVLQIGTTDLDAGRQVTWNMGAIASSGAPNALELFRKIMIASTSIPGAVSPVMIEVSVDGRPYQEMHVDGGVISQVFLYPSKMFPELEKAMGQPFGRSAHVYVIRNGRFTPEWGNTRRRTVPIAGRALSVLIQSQGVDDVYRLYKISQHDGTDFNLAYIGPDFAEPHGDEFETHYMKRLFDYAYELTVDGNAWHKAPPGEGGSQ